MGHFVALCWSLDHFIFHVWSVDDSRWYVVQCDGGMQELFGDNSNTLEAEAMCGTTMAFFMSASPGFMYGSSWSIKFQMNHQLLCLKKILMMLTDTHPRQGDKFPIPQRHQDQLGTSDSLLDAPREQPHQPLVPCCSSQEWHPAENMIVSPKHKEVWRE